MKSVKNIFYNTNKNETQIISKPYLKRPNNDTVSSIDMKKTKFNQLYYLNNKYRNSQLELRKIKLDAAPVGVDKSHACSKNETVNVKTISPAEVIDTEKKLCVAGALSSYNSIKNNTVKINVPKNIYNSSNCFTNKILAKNMGSYNRTYTKVNRIDDIKHRYSYIANNLKYSASMHKNNFKLNNMSVKSKVISNKKFMTKCEERRRLDSTTEKSHSYFGGSETQRLDNVVNEKIAPTKEFSVKEVNFVDCKKETLDNSSLNNSRKINAKINNKCSLVNKISTEYAFKNNRKLVRQKQSNTEGDVIVKKEMKYVYKNNRKLVMSAGITMKKLKTTSAELLPKTNRVTGDNLKQDDVAVKQNSNLKLNNVTSTNKQTNEITSRPLIIVSKTKVIRKCPKQDKNVRIRSENFQYTTSNKVLKRTYYNPLISVTKTKMIRKNQLKSNEAIRKQKVLPSCSSKTVTHNGSFMTVGTKKLIRIHRKSTSFKSPHKLKYKLKQSRGKLSPKVMMAKSVTSKYKYIRQRSLQNASIQPLLSDHSNSKYKIDRRSNSNIKRTNRARKCPVDGRYLKKEVGLPKYRNTLYYSRLANKVWLSTACSAKYLKPINVFIKQKSISRSHHQKYRNTRILRFSRTLKMTDIGGVLYRCSPVKLTRKSSDGKVQPSPRSTSRVKSKKGEMEHVIYIRGTKFIMDSTGSTLKRCEDNMKAKEHCNNMYLKRIDIGGVTYVHKSPNILIRTNTHRARRILCQAKQKSIAVLTQKRRKNNQLCLLYHRLGKCYKMETGNCEHVHDSKYIAVCRKFLEGHCNVEKCLLSHNLGPEKMPTCKYFLEAICARQNCPYLHVRVNPDAEICRNFLLGYCSSGQKCKKRHLFLCPEFEKSGNCRKSKLCPYPHSKVKYKVADDKKSAQSEKDTVDILRYYDGDKRTCSHEISESQEDVRSNICEEVTKEQSENEINYQNRQEFFALDFIPI